jgi:DNA-binding NarL/FixJ family response regulator
MKIRVFIVASGDLISEWINIMEGEPNIEIVDSVSALDEVMNNIAQWRSMSVNVTLMDLCVKGNITHGMYILSLFREYNLGSVVVCCRDSKYFADAYTLGAKNCLCHKSAIDLPHIIRDTHNNKGSLHADSSEEVRARLSELECRDAPRLSMSELQVLDLFAHGFSSSKIASRTYKEKSTVTTQYKSIRKKLQASSMSEAVKKAMGWGILHL